MPDLTRRRSKDAREECWHVYYDDIRVGTLSKRTGAPASSPQWEWTCGFYPGSDPGDCTNGTAADIDQARERFEAAWRVFLSKRTEADFQAWRDQKAWTEAKYAGFDRRRGVG